MLYIIAILFPPLAILFTGKIFQFIFNLILAALGIFLAIVTLGAFGLIYLLAIIHAVVVVHSYRQEKRDERLVKAVRGEK
ncbi:YqaE/Pmp3 family membrane protein [Idiomarina seosinensis]|uniref:YqaE/Pmp3 family membrane protein n=1 Tax=Idiomarina seosinensis TaxID=281739 RepID=UPI00384EA2A0